MTHAPLGSFRQRLLAGEVMLGTFIKTPTVHTTEIVGAAGFDCVVIDQEHAPFDRTTTDLLLLAARAAGTSALVRVPAKSSEWTLAALDDGAQGVVVPHVDSVQDARAAVAAARYRGGQRGFSNSPRAGRYGAASMWEHVDAADATTAVIVMIESPTAVDHVEAIAAVEGVDALFIGRGDLTVSFGAPSVDAAPIRSAVERIAAAARTHGKALCVHAGRLDAAEFRWLRGLGVTCFVVSSDQGMLQSAAKDVLTQFRELSTGR